MTVAYVCGRIALILGLVLPHSPKCKIIGRHVLDYPPTVCGDAVDIPCFTSCYATVMIGEFPTTKYPCHCCNCTFPTFTIVSLHACSVPGLGCIQSFQHLFASLLIVRNNKLHGIRLLNTFPSTIRALYFGSRRPLERGTLQHE